MKKSNPLSITLSHLPPQLNEGSRDKVQALQRRWLQPQIVLLDVGMATEMSDEDQTNMIGLFRSFAKMDGRTCGGWVLKFSGGGTTQVLNDGERSIDSNSPKEDG